MELDEKKGKDLRSSEVKGLMRLQEAHFMYDCDIQVYT